MKNWLPRFLLYWVINVAILWAAGEIAGVIRFDTTTAMLKSGLWLAVANAFFTPIVRAVTNAIVWRGIALVVINLLLLFVVEWIVAGMHLVALWRTALLAIFVWLGTFILNALIAPPTEF